MRHPDDKGIGGYFGLEPVAPSPAGPAPWPAGALRFQSARAAMAAALKASGRRRAWVPHFVCGAVLDALAWAGVQALPYPLDPDHGVPADLAVDDADGVVCVDYFGQSPAACDRAIARFGAHRVLVDASQALFHPARPGVSTVYSPRKFAGLPDGGLLATPLAVGGLAAADEAGSALRRRHLHSRAQGDVAGGYREFQDAEASLHDCTPRAMSAGTSVALDGIDWPRIAERRIANHRVLAQALAAEGIQATALPAGTVPLCGLVPCGQAHALRSRLAREGVFTAMYWPDATLPAHDEAGLRLRDRTLYLPCDQRYDAADMLGLARVLLRHWGNQ